MFWNKYFRSTLSFTCTFGYSGRGSVRNTQTIDRYDGIRTALLYPLPVDRLRVYVPLCPESQFETSFKPRFRSLWVRSVSILFIFINNHSTTGTVEIDVVKEFVDPERVIILNLDEQNEVEATRDITTRFENADVPLLPPRFLRRIVRAVYQAFPRQNIG